MTQPSHVKYLTGLFFMILGNKKGSNQVYGVSRTKNVTFSYMEKSNAKDTRFYKLEIVHCNTKEFDFSKENVCDRMGIRC